VLAAAARHGRWCLIIGLIAGLSLPDLAAFLRPYLPGLIAGLLFLAAFRIGPKAVLSGLRSERSTLWLVLLFQVAVPLLIFGLASIAGVMGTPAALAAVLVFSAPSVTGSANFALLMKARPEAALRLLMVGTALFPITVLPILFLLPALDIQSVLGAALRLIVVVLGAGGAAFLIRRGRWESLSRSWEESLDGASALLLAIVVVALMSAVGPLLLSAPVTFLIWLLFACCVNFAAQLATWFMLGHRLNAPDRAATSIVAGNRNIALFLIALPPETTAALLIFIGCYQIPMYLTPLVFRRLYTRAA